jgi:hypothetical protein
LLNIKQTQFLRSLYALHFYPSGDFTPLAPKLCTGFIPLRIAEMGWLLLMLIGALSALLIYAMLAPEKF